MKGKTKPKPPFSMPPIPEEVYVCARALDMPPAHLLDWELAVYGAFVPSIEGLERKFHPRENESLREAIVRQRGEPAAVALEKLCAFLEGKGK